MLSTMSEAIRVFVPKKKVTARQPLGPIWYPKFYTLMIFRIVHRRSFYQQLRVFALAGNPMALTIATLRDQAVESAQLCFWYVLNDIYEQMEEGKYFALALSGWCPQSEILLISSGAGGSKQMAEAISRVLSVQKKLADMRGTFIFVMMEPTAVFLGTYGLIVWMASSFLNQMLAMIPNVDVTQFTGPAHQLVVIGELGSGYRAFLPPILFIALAYLIAWSFPRWTGKTRKFFDNIPPWSIYRSVQGAGWMQTFAMLAQSKVNYSNIMRETAALGTPWLRERILAARALMTKPGLPVGAALWASGYNFPSKTIAQNLKAFGARPAFAEALSEVADEWFDSIVSNMKATSMVTSIVTMIVATLAILWLFGASNALFTQVTTLLRSRYAA